MADEPYLRLQEAYRLFQRVRGPIGLMASQGALLDRELPAAIDAYLHHEPLATAGRKADG